MAHGSVGEVRNRVLVCAPMGRDAHLIGQMLESQGISSEAQPDLASLSAELERGAGVAVLTEEALTGSTAVLAEALAGQPAWSDLPILILTTGGEINSQRTWALIRRLEPLRNVSLLERPLRSLTLLSAVQVALRSRERQYEVKSLQEDLERRVVERTLELERLNEEAEGFSYTIAHDLRSPLRAIISTSQILLEDHGDMLAVEAREELQRQARAASRLATLIDDLLKLSRLSREQMKPYEFDLSALAEEVVNELEREQEHSLCRFEVQAGLRAVGDPLLIRFALLNLMQNACKFSPDGGTVSVGSDSGIFFVADEGIGFSPAYAGRIFKPFERLVNQDHFPGTGIGLANVKRIIERHGGRVWAESEPGRGSRFFFSLPRRA
jgi:signal transduction histidine kinase